MNNNLPKFYIVGATGFMGQLFAEYLKSHNFEIFTEKIDVTDLPALKNKFSQIKPDVVINFSGAKAYPNIDWCDENKEETVSINVSGAINVALAALSVDAYPIQISSGSIYSGTAKDIFTEEDAPNFKKNFYARTKIIMEDALKELPVLILRVHMPLSVYPHPRNIIDKLISFEEIISVPNSITFLEDFFAAIVKLASQKPTGIFNVTNDGYVQNRDILEAYKLIVDPKHTYKIISADDLKKHVKMSRANCVLDNKKLKALGIEMPSLNKERLEMIMNLYKNNIVR